MNKAELISKLHKIALEDSPKETSCLVMLTMTELMKSYKGDRYCATRAKCNLAISDATGPRVIAPAIEYDVRDQELVEIAWRQAQRQNLRLEPVQLVDADKIIPSEVDKDFSDGVIALCHDRPLVIITVPADDSLQVQIGGFDKSMVFHPGNLMDLSRQVIEDGSK